MTHCMRRSQWFQDCSGQNSGRPRPQGQPCPERPDGRWPILPLKMRHPQRKSCQSARGGGAAFRLLCFHFSRCKSTARCGHRDRTRKHICIDAARDSSTENRHCVSDRAQDRLADRVRIVQRSTARKRRRPAGRESSLLSNLPRRSPRHRGRNDHRARGAGERHRCGYYRPLNIQFGFRHRPAFLCVSVVEFKYVPATRCDHRRPGWKAARALFHAVELRAGTPDRKHD